MSEICSSVKCYNFCDFMLLLRFNYFASYNHRLTIYGHVLEPASPDGVYPICFSRIVRHTSSPASVSLPSGPICQEPA
ncbi:hypothetical protein DsansV1_C42g0238821 [Dioscorea sansibarensis]